MLKISISGDSAQRRDEPELRGTVEWSFESAPSDLVVRLLWVADNAHRKDIGILGETPITSARSGRVPFAFDLSAAPNSYTGKLFSLRLLVEASTSEKNEDAVQEITLA